MIISITTISALPESKCQGDPSCSPGNWEILPCSDLECGQDNSTSNATCAKCRD